MQKARIRFWMSAIVAVTAFAGSNTANAQERRVATLAPPNSSWMKVLDRAAAEVEKATEGRVTIKYYPGGVQGDEKDVVRKMQAGSLDGAALTGSGLALIDPSMRVLELPMLFQDTKELDCVRKKMWPSFRRSFKKKGYHLGSPGDVGFVYFYSRTPIRSLTDIKKTKVWLRAEDPIVKSLFRKLGVSGVPLGVPDVLPALQTGRINATYTSPLAAVALQWNTKVRYATSMPLTYATGASVVRLAVHKKASKADRKLVRKILKKSARKIRKTVRRDNGRAMKTMKRGGVKTIDSPPAMVAKFDKASKEIWQELAGRSYSKKQLETVLAHRDTCRAK